MSTFKLETAVPNARVNRPKSAMGLMWDKLTQPVAEPSYKTLPEYHIRVLKVKPGTSQYPLRVKLKVIDPRKAKYTALSYAWDREDDNSSKTNSSADVAETILCGGTPVRVRSNLYDALCQLRDIQTDTPIFVDALCINFSDNRERTAYIEIMGHIYARATSVIVWLGKKDSTSDETMMIMKRLVNAIDWRRMKANIEAYDFRDPRFFQHIGMEPLTLKQWRQIHAFCQMKWFTRYWAFFELTLAKSALFLWGDACMEYDFLIDFGMILGLSGWLDDFQPSVGSSESKSSVGLAKMLGPVSRLRTIPAWHPRSKDFVKWMRTESGLHEEEQRAWKFFEILLESAEAFECSDPRDKAFAPLSFLRMLYSGKPINKQWPSPDYSKSVERVLNEFCTLILQYTGQPSVLVKQTTSLDNSSRSRSRPHTDLHLLPPLPSEAQSSRSRSRPQSDLKPPQPPPPPQPHQYLLPPLPQHQQLRQQLQVYSTHQPDHRGRTLSR